MELGRRLIQTFKKSPPSDRALPAILFASFLVTLFSGCAEQAGSGLSVPIPTVQISCTTARCQAASSADVYVVFTTSSCGNAAFGETVAGSATISCNAFGCVGQVTSFTGTGGVATATLPEGFYSVCAILDFNGNYIGDAVAGQDTTGAFSNTFINNQTATRSLTSFSDI